MCVIHDPIYMSGMINNKLNPDYLLGMIMMLVGRIINFAVFIMQTDKQMRTVSAQKKLTVSSVSTYS